MVAGIDGAVRQPGVGGEGTREAKPGAEHALGVADVLADCGGAGDGDRRADRPAQIQEDGRLPAAVIGPAVGGHLEGAPRALAALGRAAVRTGPRGGQISRRTVARAVPGEHEPDRRDEHHDRQQRHRPGQRSPGTSRLSVPHVHPRVGVQDRTPAGRRGFLTAPAAWSDPGQSHDHVVVEVRPSRCNDHLGILRSRNHVSESGVDPPWAHSCAHGSPVWASRAPLRGRAGPPGESATTLRFRWSPVAGTSMAFGQAPGRYPPWAPRPIAGARRVRREATRDVIGPVPVGRAEEASGRSLAYRAEEASGRSLAPIVEARDGGWFAEHRSAGGRGVRLSADPETAEVGETVRPRSTTAHRWT